MKNLILIKKHSAVQLAHVYEHLFLIQVNEYLYDRGLFKWLDFSINGTTYEEGGLVVVDYKAYSDHAVRVTDHLMNFKIEITEERVLKALLQLKAEEKYELIISSYEDLISELLNLEKTPWQDLDTFTAYDTKGVRRRANPVYLTHELTNRPRAVKVSLEIDSLYLNKDRAVIAVFNTIARFILFTATYRIAAESGSYQAEMYAQKAGQMITVDLHYSKAAKIPDYRTLADEVKDVVAYIRSKGGLNRLAGDFSSVSYASMPNEAPDFERILRETQIILGSEGWSKYSSEDTLLNILEHTQIIVRSAGKNPQASSKVLG